MKNLTSSMATGEKRTAGTMAEVELEIEPRSDTTWSKISGARSNSNFLKGKGTLVKNAFVEKD